MRKIPSATLAGLAALGALSLATILALWLLWDTQAGLARRHALLSRAQRSVTTLQVEGVGEFPLFLNPDDPVITTLILARRGWEANETYWFSRSVGPGDTVVDVGANIGYYTVLGALLVGDSGHVYAFEPDPESFAFLERNVRLNGLHNVTLEQKALSNRPGQIRLFLSERNKGDHRIFDAPDEERESIEIEAVTLDDYLRGRGDEVDFIKVDTQGAEAVIVEGMQRLLASNNHVRMAMEFSPWLLEQFGNDPAELLATLQAHGFRFFDIGTGRARVGLMEPVNPIWLLRNFPGDSKKQFTNVYLTKGPPPRRALVSRPRARH
ncbi:MAG: FkbM family methyltransferase [Myxococcota bacterium]